MTWSLYPLAVAAGFVAGFVNTLAGSGSLITLPLLIFMGLPATVANGTNRIAILMQNLVAVDGFQRQRLMDWRGALLLGVPATVGSLLGAQIAANLNALVMQRTIGVLLIAMLILVLVRPERWLKGEGTPHLDRWSWPWFLGFFLIGMYGGFIQVGVGIFLLAALVLGIGYNLARANAVKVAIILFYIPFDLFIFWRNGQVQWWTGAVLGIGSMLGAWTATRTAARAEAIWLWRLLAVVVALSAAQLLGASDLLHRLLSWRLG
jgi:hypothetical protein